MKKQAVGCCQRAPVVSLSGQDPRQASLTDGHRKWAFRLWGPHHRKGVLPPEVLPLPRASGELRALQLRDKAGPVQGGRSSAATGHGVSVERH